MARNRSNLDRLAERLGLGSIGRRVAGGAIWSVLQGALTQGAVMVSTILVARILGGSQFGRYALFQTTMAIITTIVATGIGMSATKYVAEARNHPERQDDVTGFFLRLSAAAGLGLALLLFITAPLIARALPDGAGLALPLRIGAGSLVFTSIATSQAGILSGLEQFKLLARAGVAKSIATVVFTVTGAKLAGLVGAAAGTLGSQLAACVINYAYVRRTVPLRWGAARLSIDQTLGVLRRFGGPAMIAGVAGPVAQWLASSILVRHSGGYEQLGIYNAATQFFTAMTAVSVLAGQALMPVLAERMKMKAHGDASEAVRFTLKASLLVAVPTVAIGCLVAEPVMSLFGADFHGRGAVLRVALVTGGLYVLQTAGGPYLAAAGRMWLGAFINVAWGILFVGSTHLLSGSGAMGMSLARLIAYAASGLGTLYVLRFAFQRTAAPDTRGARPADR